MRHRGRGGGEEGGRARCCHAPVVNEPRDVLFGHFRQLLLEDDLGTRQQDQAGFGAVVLNHPKLNDTGRLVPACALALGLGHAIGAVALYDRGGGPQCVQNAPTQEWR